MKLRPAIEAYIEWRQAHGAKFHGSAQLLHHYCRQLSVDIDIDCEAVSETEVLRVLSGTGPLTRTRANKYGILAGFYRFARSRGYVDRSPLPTPASEPKRPGSAPPWVFSRDELQRLFAAIDCSRQRAVKLDASTLRTVLLLLYGAGLRLNEALQLRLDDVDLGEAVLTIADAKFYKSRLVPVGRQLAETLRHYARRRKEFCTPNDRDPAFLLNLDGTPLVSRTVREAFTNLLKVAGVQHDPGDERRPPNLHSLRHTAAVHRVENWYRQDADVSRLLPVLSTWLGHANLDGTRVYLTMTPALLSEASRRFEQLVEGGEHE